VAPPFRSYRIDFPAGMKLLTANEVRKAGHWTRYAPAIATIRHTACLLARKKQIPKLQQVKIKAIYHPPDNRRRDTSNIFPSVKSAVDGIVDAGVLIDDNDKFVKSVEMVRGDNVKRGKLVIVITEVAGDGGCS
jgi:crossover junction endodeoxyribonuclease RusA